MKTVQSNARFFGLISQNLGKDWLDLTNKIDHELATYKFELSEEKVFLFSGTSPASMLEGDGEVAVFRSVIGAKQNVEKPFILLDWELKTVFKEKIFENDWDQILLAASKSWENLSREGRNLRPGFWILAQRNISSGLELSIEVMFHE